MRVNLAEVSTNGERGSEVDALRVKLAEAESRLAEAQEVIRAIQSGDVDAVVVSGPQGEQVFTLKGAEYAYRALVEAMNEGAATLGADGTVLYCNQRLSDFLEIPLEQIIGRPAAQLVGDEARHTFEALFARAISGDAATAEIEVCAINSGRRPMHVSLREMQTDEPTAVCMVVTDLTEHRKQDELIAAGKLATSILESAAEAIAVCDETGKIISVNEALESLCGFSPLYQPFDTALPLQVGRDSAPSVRQFSIAKALSGTVHRGTEVIYRRQDGQRFLLLLSSGPIAGPSGVIGCVLTMTDITDRERVEQALFQSEKLASVGRMASTIAHEINNPLETIGHAVYLALTDPNISKESKSYLDMAVQELERVTHITKQTLSFHRENRTATLVDLRESVDGVLKLYAGRLKSRNISVEKRYGEVVCVNAVAGEVRQMISNLLSNSMDAVSSDGKIRFRVSRSLKVNGTPGVRFTVADTGSGISSEQLKRIFEPFFTTKEVIGTGLGLWVTKQLVEKHAATIRVRSIPALGTVFSITFPAPETR